LSELVCQGGSNVLVPLTDSRNPYTAMMLELIANDRSYPASMYPRERNVAARRPASGPVSRGRRLALIAAALVGVAVLAFVTGLI
jgi:hypothetical protein